MFIAFEGPEGSGKSTQIMLLSGWVRERGLSVLTTREPGGTAIGDRVRAILLDHAASEMSPQAEVLLFSAARAQLVSEVIRPHLEAGGVVLCDRFADSTMAYQGYGHQLPLDKLATITEFATGGLRPDLVAYLDIDVQAGLRRKQQHAQDDAGQWNRMEAKALAFHERVRAGYLAMAAADPARWLVVDAGQRVEDVQGHLRARVAEMLSLVIGDR
ncbi:MAG: dTMP kinase [Anaerolineae bacterium]|nr:dTMP kinase [Anaerolineae bacterium]HRX01558.1 dTMP kinase [Anaerolineae bacterium]